MVIIYSAEWCGPCAYAKKLLDDSDFVNEFIKNVKV